ncbi:hypothetical protein [Perlucidibaca aquatica]|uniref:hypothetical protein n=1 Tax=Perlucidibaca aquatica TaxID=1852776 RepID=UPI0012FD9518|nr:hypothetical protein [Perlucidibaca aquatica]
MSHKLQQLLQDPAAAGKLREILQTARVGVTSEATIEFTVNNETRRYRPQLVSVR